MLNTYREKHLFHLIFVKNKKLWVHVGVAPEPEQALSHSSLLR